MNIIELFSYVFHILRDIYSAQLIQLDVSKTLSVNAPLAPLDLSNNSYIK